MSFSPTDEALFAAHLEGERDAFKQLFARHAPSIFGVMVRRGLSRADAHDLVQKTFLSLHQARKDFRPGARVSPWLWTIAFNHCRLTARSHARAASHLECLCSMPIPLWSSLRSPRLRPGLCPPAPELDAHGVDAGVQPSFSSASATVPRMSTSSSMMRTVSG